MKKEIIGAKLSSMEEPVKVEVNLPETTSEAIEYFNSLGLNGEEVVYGRFLASYIIDLQAFMRSHMKGENPILDSARMQPLVDEWKPGAKGKGKTPAEKVRDLFARLSADEREAILAELGLGE